MPHTFPFEWLACRVLSIISNMTINPRSPPHTIKKAYLKGTKHFHPDRNSNNVNAANESFKLFKSFEETVQQIQEYNKSRVWRSEFARVWINNPLWIAERNTLLKPIYMEKLTVVINQALQDMELHSSIPSVPTAPSTPTPPPTPAAPPPTPAAPPPTPAPPPPTPAAPPPSTPASVGAKRPREYIDLTMEDDETDSDSVSFNNLTIDDIKERLVKLGFDLIDSTFAHPDNSLCETCGVSAKNGIFKKLPTPGAGFQTKNQFRNFIMETGNFSSSHTLMRVDLRNFMTWVYHNRKTGMSLLKRGPTSMDNTGQVHSVISRIFAKISTGCLTINEANMKYKDALLAYR